MHKFLLIAGAALLSMVAVRPVQAGGIDLYVQPGGPGGGGPWDDAYGSIQEALDFIDLLPSNLPFQINIAQGTYSQTAPLEVRGGVDLVGGYRGNDGVGDPNDRDPEQFPTILTTGSGIDIVRYDTATGTFESAVDGLSFSSGAAGLKVTGTAGGLTDLAVRDCRFVDNVVGFQANPGDFLIEDSTFEGNGTGAETDLSNVEVNRCGFLDNKGTGLDCNEGGVHTVMECVFSGNGGDGLKLDIPVVEVHRCVFKENGGAGISGCVSATQKIVNCLFNDNAEGGVMSDFACGFTGINCTFASLDPLAGPALGGFGGTLRNCVVWGGSSPPIAVESAATVTYSNIQSGFPGAGNIDADPLFVDAANGDFRLQPGSPVIDAGDSTTVPARIDLDLDGNDRFRDDLGTPDTGVRDGKTPVVDMGAYEFQGQTPVEWAADTNDDGVVNVVDLVNVILAWGSDDANADVNGDGIVNVVDLVTVILAWGPCPD